MIDPGGDAAFEALLARMGGDLLILVDDRLRIVRAGEEAASLAERPLDDIAGMSLIAAFGSAALDAVAREAITGGAAASGEADLGHLGSRRFAIDAAPLAGGLVLSLHDVTALRRMERVRRDFIGNIGHELRTPLTSIKLLAETLATGTVDDAATTRDFAAQIEREADHLSQLVDELLELSMIESGETRLSLEALDPEEVVAACAERIGPVAERNDIRVVRLPPPTASTRAHADPGRLGQAMLNLAHNAVKYSHHGGEVRIGWEPMGDAVRFTVADDGIGVPDAHQQRIFERFYKVEPSRAPERDTQRRLAAAHGGSVGVTSEEGIGSTFWIEVPQVVPETEA